MQAPAIEAMCRLLTHRGPDDDGFFVQGNAGLAMRRLQIIDPEGGKQPQTNEDGTLDSNEDITYSLYDAYGDGGLDLGRKAGSGDYQPVAENIDVLNFVYFDANGSTPVADLENIRSVQVTLVARSGMDINYTDASAYYNDQGNLILGAQNDHFRRRLLTNRVQCRNMGL